MVYAKEHKEGECDKCLKDVGIHNLVKVPFLYLDRNDKVHEDAVDNPKYKDYKQYHICVKCRGDGTIA